MPYNLIIVDYGLSLPGSVHDAFAFQSTHLYHDHDNLLAPGHWAWGDSAYALEPWLIVPYKKPSNGSLMANQTTFNYYLSKVNQIISNYL